MMKFQQLLLLSILSSAVSFQSTPRWTTATRSSTQIQSTHSSDDDRRSFVKSLLVGAAATVLSTTPANAGIDPSLLKSYSVEGDASGSAQRLRQIEEIQRPASDTVNIPYEKLPSGVEYREYREGKGEAGT